MVKDANSIDTITALNDEELSNLLCAMVQLLRPHLTPEATHAIQEAADRLNTRYQSELEESEYN